MQRIKYIIIVCGVSLFMLCLPMCHASDAHLSDYSELTDVQPDPRDITAGEVLVMAKDVLTKGFGYSEEILAQYVVTARFLYSPDFMHGHEPVWYIRFTPEKGSDEAHQVLYTYRGELIGAARAGEEIVQPYYERYYPWTREDTINAEGLGFYEWTLEEKAAFSSKWVPIVNEYCARNYYFTGSGHPMYDATRYVYGLPTDEDVPLSEAIHIAKEAALANGATEYMLQRRVITFYFDITDASCPLWKIWIHGNTSDEPYGSYVDDGMINCVVIIDAKTGTILSITDEVPATGYY